VKPQQSSRARQNHNITADLIPWHDTAPEDLVAETAYRRGFHHGLATAVNLLTDLGSDDALRLMKEATEITGELRRARKTYLLMHEVYERVVKSRRRRKFKGASRCSATSPSCRAGSGTRPRERCSPAGTPRPRGGASHGPAPVSR
jgi:hypothetical protein